MSAAHTPGPWAQDIFKAANGGQCFGVKSTATNSAVAWTHGRTVDEDIANARLIASAPELLAAAQRVLSHKRGKDDWLVLAVHCCELEAAIAKATGASA